MSIADIPAFPTPIPVENPAMVDGEYRTAIGGLTYRQWLIGQALKGLLSNPTTTGGYDAVAKQAANYADAQIRLEDQQ